MEQEATTTNACRWCRMVESGVHALEDDVAFVLFGSLPGRRGGLTLVPRAHVGALADLPLPQMAAVLGGLTRASDRLRETSGACGVRIQPHPTATRRRGGRSHVHFQLAPEEAAVSRTLDWVADSPYALASLIESISR